MEQACIRCGSLHIRRHDLRSYREIDLTGVHYKAYQRWFCVDCGCAFIPERHQRADASPYQADVRERAAILYVEVGASYRAVVRELRRHGVNRVDAKKIWQWVQALAHQCSDAFTLSQKLKPRWTGWLQVDGDRLPGIRERSIVIALDVGTRDIPCGFVGPESFASYRKLFEQLKALNYPLRGLTSDGADEIVKAGKAVFGKVIHQRCTVHVGRNLEDALRPHYATYAMRSREIQRFQQTYKSFVESPTWKEAKDWLRILYYYPAFQRLNILAARNLFLTMLPQITPAFFHPEMPRHTNVIENVFRFVDRRITPMDRFQSQDTAEAMVKLLLLWYRFHKFSNPSKAYWHMKGQSPLDLAGVDTRGLNWLKTGIGA